MAIWVEWNALTADSHLSVVSVILSTFINLIEIFASNRYKTGCYTMDFYVRCYPENIKPNSGKQ